MEVATSPPAAQPQESQETRTIADLVPRAAASYGELPAIRFKHEGAWQDVSYSELGEIVQEVALGLIDLGIAPGERLWILAGTRPEWSYADLGATSAGIVVVPVYQTNSPEECHWVLSDSGACAVVCEDEEQLAKILAVRDRLPDLRAVIVHRVGRRGNATPPPPSSRAVSRSRSCACAGAPATPRSSSADAKGCSRRTPTRSSTPPAPPGRRRAACSPTATTARSSKASSSGACCTPSSNDVVYLFLPLAHSFALLIQLVVFDLGVTLAYFGGDTKQIIAELARGAADLSALGTARVRKDLHAGRREQRPGVPGQGDERGHAGAPTRTRRQADPRGAQGALRGSRGQALQERARGLRRAPARGAQRRRARSARRSSSSSSPPACP